MQLPAAESTAYQRLLIKCVVLFWDSFCQFAVEASDAGPKVSLQMQLRGETVFSLSDSSGKHQNVSIKGDASESTIGVNSTSAFVFFDRLIEVANYTHYRRNALRASADSLFSLG